MGEISELDGYKQLLQVTENIIQQLSPEDEIIRKYFILKKSVLAKVKNPQQSISSPLSPKILHAYKSLAKTFLQVLSEFQSEIQGEMDKHAFYRNTNKILKNIEKETKILSQQLSSFSQQNKNIKLMMKEEVNQYKFSCKELEGKIENMGLMIEVHHKMHEIILQASQKQAKTVQKEGEYNKRLGEMQEVVQQVQDVKKFLDSYELTQKKLKKFDLARKNLAKVLFDF